MLRFPMHWLRLQRLRAKWWLWRKSVPFVNLEDIFADVVTMTPEYRHLRGAMRTQVTRLRTLE
jgi:hypothetical protein